MLCPIVAVDMDMYYTAVDVGRVGQDTNKNIIIQDTFIVCM